MKNELFWQGLRLLLKALGLLISLFNPVLLLIDHGAPLLRDRIKNKALQLLTTLAFCLLCLLLHCALLHFIFWPLFDTLSPHSPWAGLLVLVRISQAYVLLDCFITPLLTLYALEETPANPPALGA